MSAQKTKQTADEFRAKLKLKHLETKSLFSNKYKKAEDYLNKKGLNINELRQHSAKVISAGALAGTLFLSPPVDLKALPPPGKVIEKLKLAGESVISLQTSQKDLLDSMAEILPDTPRPLTREEEKSLEQIFEKVIGIPAKATLEGEHLNTTYGYIGAEQHLRRYPGDVNENHAPDSGDYGDDRPANMLKEGMAPGLGAWGYFASTKNALTPDLEDTEKWYSVAQTLYLPDWGKRQPYLRDWYKYRKVLIVNTKNGKAVVTAIADAGPAAWTGKHYGGSPEVMDYLGGPRYKKGAVVFFFVDDPNNKIPLGPVEYNTVNINALTAKI